MRDVDKIVELIRNICPAVKVEQLKVLHLGADDDGIWFFEQRASEFEVQIASSWGMCPFVVETDESDERFTANTVEETVEILERLLHLGDDQRNPRH